MSPVNHQTQFAHKLSRYALGIGALAAGNALPQKADATLITETFSGLTDPSAIYLRFDGNMALRAGVGYGFPGFNLIECGMNIGFSHYGGAQYTYQALVLNTATEYTNYNDMAPLITTPRTDIDLTRLGPEYAWNINGGGAIYNAPVGVPLFAGLRKVTASGTYYGWAEIERGSVTINSAAFNNTADGSVLLGVVPEPSTLGLLAAGAAGLSALRKRRKKAAAEA